MKNSARNSRNRRWIARAAGTFALGAALLVAPSAALAHREPVPQRHHRHHEVQERHRSKHRHAHGHSRYGHEHRYERKFKVPRRIEIRHQPRFDRYFWFSSIDPVHRHRHDIYRFPVATDYGYVYRPHVYCDGVLYHRGSVTYDGPRFRVSVRF